MKEQSINRYEAYKDSGVEWLGEVPSKWRNAKVKSTCSHLKDGTHGSFQRVDDGYPLLSVRNIVNSKFVLLSDDSQISESDYNTISKPLKIKEGDLQLAIVGATLGKVALVPKNMPKFVTQRSLATLRPIAKILYNKFLFYFSSSAYFQDTLWSKANYSAQPGIYLYTISNIDILLPSIPEQQTIANYLDTKTAQIDRQIDLLSQKAAQYGKLKQSLINETVTRGLDKTVDMKDSGVEWIGDVPAHWELKRIKDTTYVKGRIGWQGLRNEDFLVNGNYYCVTGTDLKQGNIDWSNCYFVDEERYKQDTYIQLKIDDILITKDGTIGKVAIVKDIPLPATLNSGVFVTRPLKNSYMTKFMYWVLNSYQFTAYIDLTKGGSTIQHLYQNVFNRFIFTSPSLLEQQAIANYLDEKTAHIDRIVATINSQIDKLKELRKTLINDIVTGKICVCKPEPRHE